MGHHWDFNYNARISFNQPNDDGFGVEDPVDEIVVFFGNSRRDMFERYTQGVGNSVDHYASPKVSKRLSYTRSNEPVILVDEKMTTYKFFPGYPDQNTQYGGRLESITDRNGNRITFVWQISINGVARIDYAIDTLDNQINFVYHDEQYSGVVDQSTFPDGYMPDQLLWLVVDHAGRIVQYNYNIQDTSIPPQTTTGFDFWVPQLTSVTLPSIESSAGYFSLPTEHERFQDGRTWTYEYDNRNVLDQWKGRMLTTITNPNGDTVVQNEYRTTSSGDRNDGRVFRQVYGESEYNYIVTDLRGSVNGVGYFGEYYVWVNDRRGVITRFRYKGRDMNDPNTHRQLVERVVYDGFVADADRSVYAELDASGVILSWRAVNETYPNDFFADPYTGPGGMLDPEKFITSWETDQNWNPSQIQLPIVNGFRDRVDSTYIVESPSTQDPRSWGSRLTQERYSASTAETISESWAYEFDFAGACSCGSGTDGFATGHSDGRNLVTIKEFDSAANAITGNSTGNLKAVFHDLAGGSIYTDPVTARSLASAIDEYTYNQWGQVTSHTHPEKTVLDANGNEITHNRVDTFVYYIDSQQDGNNYGRLKQRIVDDVDTNSGTTSNYQLTTTYEYDAIGNVIKETHPDGDVSVYLYNQAYQLVIEQHYDDNGPVVDPYAQTDYFYDANGNLIRQEVQNRNPDQSLASNQSITTVYSYDTLDFRKTVSREHGDFNGAISEIVDDPGRRLIIPADGDTDFVTQKWDYDAGKNMTRFSDGQAVMTTGSQASNVVDYVYDSRNLLVQKTTGTGDANPLVVTAKYDEKSRVDHVIINASNTSEAQRYDIQYDGFDRVMSYTDPMGNEMRYKYDGNHNVVESYYCGPLDIDNAPGVGDSGDTLYRATSTFDNRDRLKIKQVDIFEYDYATGSGETCGNVPVSSTQQSIEYVYNRDSSIRTMKELSGDASSLKLTDFYYDTASRVEVVYDGDGNNSFSAYDADSNLISISKLDFSTIIGSPFEEFIMHFEYDALDRRSATVDGAGNRTETKYDSRHNAVEFTDARGNITTLSYDGMNRLIGTQVVMTDTGDGAGTQIAGPDGTIVTSKAYDDSSRVISETDDNGNTTLYTYDGLNRVTMITMPDGEEYTTQYDDNGNIKVYTDARGVISTHAYDLNNRLLSRVITGTDIPGADSESFLYDGLGRLREATNGMTKIMREYDSRSNVVKEIQNANSAGFPASSDRVVLYEHDQANNLEKIVYSGGREIHRAFDRLNRMVGVFNDAAHLDPVSEFNYIGSRLQSRVHGNGTRTVYQYNGEDGGLAHIDDHGFGRVSKITTSTIGAGTVLDSFEFRWDQTQNKSAYLDVGSGMTNRRERTFGYDSSNRLVSSVVDYADSMSTKTDDTTSYTLDGVHNRLDVAELVPSDEGDAGAALGTYELNGNQKKNNQYSLSPRQAGGNWAHAYDANGNLTDQIQDTTADLNGDYEVDFLDASAFLAAYQNQEPLADINGDGFWDSLDISTFMTDFTLLDGTGLERWHFSYDFRNQLVRTQHGFGAAESDLMVVIHTYDAAARRVLESEDVDNDGTIDAARQFVYGGASLWEVIEQIDLAGSTETLLTTHLFGLGIDDEIGYRRENQSPPDDFWSHRDDLNSLTSITNDSGTVVERYEFGDYGRVRIMDALGVERADSLFGAFHLYTGRPMLAGTGLYDYRYRVMDPATGRFGQRDPLGYIDSMNFYALVTNNPHSYYDPYGLDSYYTGVYQVDVDLITISLKTNSSLLPWVKAKKASVYKFTCKCEKKTEDYDYGFKNVGYVSPLGGYGPSFPNYEWGHWRDPSDDKTEWIEKGSSSVPASLADDLAIAGHLVGLIPNLAISTIGQAVLAEGEQNEMFGVEDDYPNDVVQPKLDNFKNNCKTICEGLMEPATCEQ